MIAALLYALVWLFLSVIAPGGMGMMGMMGMPYDGDWYDGDLMMASPAMESPAAEAQSRVADAILLYDQQGRDAAIARYNDKASTDGPWYVFIIDENGIVVASAPRPDNVGVAVDQLPGLIGEDGHNYGTDIANAPESGDWVQYTYRNPDTGREETKHSWVIRHDGLVFGSGWYEGPAASSDYTRAFVAEAARRYDALGRDAVVDYYNTPDSVYGEWYVFIIDDDDGIVAHPTRPERIGLIFDQLVDINGYNYGADFADADEYGRWVSYMYRNPFTDAEEQKHSWVVRRDNLIIGSGWYEK